MVEPMRGIAGGQVHPVRRASPRYPQPGGKLCVPASQNVQGQGD